MAYEDVMRKIGDARTKAIRAPQRAEGKPERSYREGFSAGLEKALKILAEERRQGSAPEPEHRPAPAVVDLKPAEGEGLGEAVSRMLGGMGE